MDSDFKILLSCALDKYLNKFDGFDLEPRGKLTSYEFGFLEGYLWSTHAKEMVRSDLQEIVNKLNRWHGYLESWHAWNNVIAGYDEEQAWVLRFEFLESIAHCCLLYPSAMRDTISTFAIYSLHQLCLSLSDKRKDCLMEDQDKGVPCRLSYKQKKKQLLALFSDSGLARGDEFIALLDEINSESYQVATFDYRNSNSHFIGPRLAMGTVRIVSRVARRAGENKKTICYEFGGIEPLDMEEIRIKNLKQYRQTRKCLEQYLIVLKDGLNRLAF